MKGEKNKKHHFIPQCYLRYFSNNRKSINIYSKKRNRSSPIQAISKTACEDYFYRIPEKFIANLDNQIFHPNFFEKEFFDDNIEKLLGPILKTIDCAVENWKTNKIENEVLQKSDKEVFAGLIAVQYLRLPNIRDLNWSFYTKSNNERLDIVKSILSAEFPENKSFMETINLEIDEEYKLVLHAKTFANENLIYKLQDCILDKIWIFYVSNEDDFYTSDNPIILKPHIGEQSSFYDEGVEIIFPISSSVLLTLWDKKHFEDKIFQDNKFNIINSKSKNEYNCYQYLFANDEVYSKNDNFKLIELLKYVNGGNEKFIKKPTVLVNGK
ncbi:hypothetical protein C3L50_09790 [Flavobacterium alvei]|uniref:DUF4238 domain-containing protein n=1 Tax=Flavobacterium alvei TaxID=2080416 RepID=A0A2S5AA78_9FLAO|nr:DUF4238 domain-containing protein [Flavobacterium alvei]POY39465.1 hypothetical protein C3L50_09790 [Flavobacterium alvei]